MAVHIAAGNTHAPSSVLAPRFTVSNKLYVPPGRLRICSTASLLRQPFLMLGPCLNPSYPNCGGVIELTSGFTFDLRPTVAKANGTRSRTSLSPHLCVFGSCLTITDSLYISSWLFRKALSNSIPFLPLTQARNRSFFRRPSSYSDLTHVWWWALQR